MKVKNAVILVCMVMGIALSANAQSKKTNVQEQTTTQQREEQVAPETHNSRKLNVKPAPQQPAAPQSKPTPNATEQNKQKTTSSTKLQETKQVNAGDNNARRVESSKKLDPKTVQKTKPKKSTQKMSKGKN